MLLFMFQMFKAKLSAKINLQYYCENEWKHGSNFTTSSFDEIFGIQDDRFLTDLFLCVKYNLYVCQF